VVGRLDGVLMVFNGFLEFELLKDQPVNQKFLEKLLKESDKSSKRTRMSFKLPTNLQASNLHLVLQYLFFSYYKVVLAST
jgi:hypothetical protein